VALKNQLELWLKQGTRTLWKSLGAIKLAAEISPVAIFAVFGQSMYPIS